MNKILFVLGLFASSCAFGQGFTTPDHIVILMDENRDYSEIVGSHFAPYINSLIADTSTALFTNSYALVSGSQPNYLMLFSGSTQGVSGSTITSVQFTDCNMGASLIQSGKTFIGYSEDQPSVGFLGTTSGNYARKHNPWSNWQGTGSNQLPPSTNVPLTDFPTDFDSLPTVSFVVPNLLDDMHSPADSTAITPGDTWLQTHMDSYVQWAKTHNSLFIFTFDESSADIIQHILTIFVGQNVRGGTYTDSIDNYRILRTIEDMYHLPYCGNSATETPITEFWKHGTAATAEIAPILNKVVLAPNPSAGNPVLSVFVTTEQDAVLTLADRLGRTIATRSIHLLPGQNSFDVNYDYLPAGCYFISVTGGAIRETTRMIVGN